MATFDYKKEYKELYQPPTSPHIVDVPAMQFLSIQGQGNPNQPDGSFAQAMEILYGLSYAIRMNKELPGYFPYVVPPCEGFWDSSDGDPQDTVLNKDHFLWTLVIRQPDFVTPSIVEQAKETVQRKKPHLDVSLATLLHFAEGLCVQALHIGPYDTEPATLLALKGYQKQRGYSMDYTDTHRQ